MEECVFCRIIEGKIPSYRVYRDKMTLAFLDINPNSRGHTLVVPRQHASNITELDDIYVDAVFRTVKKVVKGLQYAIQPEGFNIFVNQGEVAGQVISHFHCHIMPRNTGDGIEVSIKGTTLSDEEFRDMAKRISEEIN